MELRVLVLLQKDFRQQAEELGLLRRSNEEIANFVSQNYQGLQELLNKGLEGDHDWRYEERLAAERRHQELLNTLNSQLKNKRIDDSEGHHELVDFSYKKNMRLAKWILESLQFRTIFERKQGVSKNHEDTFEWIFKDPQAHTKPWTNFPQWLEKGTGCYWINGKAGSGKSTLMKYISNDRRTKAMLDKWAGSGSLMISSFFFWALGTSLQKSQDGFLRALLFGILSQKPEWIPAVFPHLWMSLIYGGSTSSSTLSVPDLKEAFYALIDYTRFYTNFFFLVDGLDEFQGEQDELSDLFLEISKRSNVKALISSRPTPTYVEAFSRCDTLKLQDLTHDDIGLYVQDKLASHTLMQRLESVETDASARITREIQAKASGVFLWVVLVTRKLLNGLRNYDKMDDLLRYLDELPNDLERLYRHMLSTLNPYYRRQSSRILQLVLISTQMQSQYPMTVLQLSYAEDEDYGSSLQAPIKAIDSKEEEWRCEMTEGRMRSRCCGLVEVQDCNKHSSCENSSHDFVQFLHRSVVEFLLLPNIWDDLLTVTNDGKFDVGKALMSSALCELKSKPALQAEGAWYVTRNFFIFCRMRAYAESLNDLDEGFRDEYMFNARLVLERYWPDTPALSGEEARDAETTSMQGCQQLGLTWPESMRFHIALRGPCVILEEAEAAYEETSMTKQRMCAYLLVLFLEQHWWPHRRLIAKRMRTIWMTATATGTGIEDVYAMSEYCVTELRLGARRIPANHPVLVSCETDDMWCPWQLILASAFGMALSTNELFLKFMSRGSPGIFVDMLAEFAVSGTMLSCTILVMERDVRGNLAAGETVSGMTIVKRLFERITDYLNNPSHAFLVPQLRNSGDSELIIKAQTNIDRLMGQKNFIKAHPSNNLTLVSSASAPRLERKSNKSDGRLAPPDKSKFRFSDLLSKPELFRRIKSAG